MNALVRLSAVSLALAGALGASTAQAGTANDTFQVAVEMQNSCTVTVNDMSFGQITSLGSNTDASTSVTVNCSSIGGVTVAFNAGTGTGSTIPARIMNSGANTIAYNLYRDSARTELLGDGTPSNGLTLSIDPTTGGGTGDSVTIYGRIPSSGTAKRTGVYTSNVQATVTF